MYTEDSSKRIQEILNQFTPKKTPIKIEKKPNFQERLKTFSVSTWYSKPYELNPLVCAQHGYVNSSEDFLTCVDCNKMLCFKTLDPEVQKELVPKFLQKMKQEHKKSCIFETPSPNHFVNPFLQTIPSENEKKISKEKSLYKNRLESYQFQEIPKLLPEFLEEVKNYNIDLVPNNKNSKELAWISIFYWDFEKVSGKDYLSCPFCQSKRILRNGQNFYPSKEHRWWCPVICKQNKPIGWILLFNGLIKAPEQNSDPFDKLKQIKNILDIPKGIDMGNFIELKEKDLNLTEKIENMQKFSNLKTPISKETPNVSVINVSTPDGFKFGQTPTREDSFMVAKELFSNSPPKEQTKPSQFNFGVENSFQTQSFSFGQIEQPKKVQEKMEKEKTQETQGKLFFELATNPFPFSEITIDKSQLESPNKGITFQDISEGDKEIKNINPTIEDYTVQNISSGGFSFGDGNQIDFKFDEKKKKPEISDEEDEKEEIVEDEKEVKLDPPPFSFGQDVQIDFKFDEKKKKPIFSDEEESPRKEEIEKTQVLETESSVFGSGNFDSHSFNSQTFTGSQSFSDQVSETFKEIKDNNLDFTKSQTHKFEDITNPFETTQTEKLNQEIVPFHYEGQIEFKFDEKKKKPEFSDEEESDQEEEDQEEEEEEEEESDEESDKEPEKKDDTQTPIFSFGDGNQIDFKFDEKKKKKPIFSDEEDESPRKEEPKQELKVEPKEELKKELKEELKEEPKEIEKTQVLETLSPVFGSGNFDSQPQPFSVSQTFGEIKENNFDFGKPSFEQVKPFNFDSSKQTSQSQEQKEDPKNQFKFGSSQEEEPKSEFKFGSSFGSQEEKEEKYDFKFGSSFGSQENKSGFENPFGSQDFLVLKNENQQKLEISETHQKESNFSSQNPFETNQTEKSDQTKNPFHFESQIETQKFEDITGQSNFSSQNPFETSHSEKLNQEIVPFQYEGQIEFKFDEKKKKPEFSDEEESDQELENKEKIEEAKPFTFGSDNKIGFKFDKPESDDEIVFSDEEEEEKQTEKKPNTSFNITNLIGEKEEKSTEEPKLSSFNFEKPVEKISESNSQQTYQFSSFNFEKPKLEEEEEENDVSKVLETNVDFDEIRKMNQNQEIEEEEVPPNQDIFEGLSDEYSEEEKLNENDVIVIDSDDEKEGEQQVEKLDEEEEENSEEYEQEKSNEQEVEQEEKSEEYEEKSEEYDQNEEEKSEEYDQNEEEKSEEYEDEKSNEQEVEQGEKSEEYEQNEEDKSNEKHETEKLQEKSNQGVITLEEKGTTTYNKDNLQEKSNEKTLEEKSQGMTIFNFQDEETKEIKERSEQLNQQSKQDNTFNEPTGSLEFEEESKYISSTRNEELSISQITQEVLQKDTPGKLNYKTPVRLRKKNEKKESSMKKEISSMKKTRSQRTNDNLIPTSLPKNLHIDPSFFTREKKSPSPSPIISPIASPKKRTPKLAKRKLRLSLDPVVKKEGIQTRAMRKLHGESKVEIEKVDQKVEEKPEKVEKVEEKLEKVEEKEKQKPEEKVDDEKVDQKPEEKPEEKPDQKPEEKVDQKIEQKPEQIVEEKGEETQDKKRKMNQEEEEKDEKGDSTLLTPRSKTLIKSRKAKKKKLE